MKKNRNIDDEIVEALHTLKLASAADEFLRQNSEPDIVSMRFEDRLLTLLEYEKTQRRLKRQVRLLKESGIVNCLASIEDLDYSSERKLNKSLLRQLASCKWLAESKQPSVVVTGATGVGKTVLIKTLGKQATLHSYSALYVRYPELIEQMKIARKKDQAPELRKKLVSKDLLIIDDFAMGNIDSNSFDDLLSLIDARSGVRATIYASQITISGWYDVFGNDPRTEALLDRIKNYSYKIAIKGPSMRAKGGEPES